MKESILVVEDSVVTSVTLARIIERALPNHRTLRAQSLFEANLLLRVYEFQLVVLDVNLPDGSGLDLIQSVNSLNVGTGIIVVTGDSFPRHRERLERLGVHHFLQKPVRSDLLVKAVQEFMRSARPQGDTVRFTARLNDLSVLDVIQLKCLTAATASLEVSDPRLRFGRIEIERGEIIHAEMRDADLQVVGQDAIKEILSWSGGTVEDLPAQPVGSRTVTGSWQSLLLEAAQKLDEETKTVSAV